MNQTFSAGRDKASKVGIEISLLEEETAPCV